MYSVPKRILSVLKPCLILLFCTLFLLGLFFTNCMPCLQRVDRSHYRLSIGRYCVTWNAQQVRHALRQNWKEICHRLPLTGLGNLIAGTSEDLFFLTDQLRADPRFTALWDFIMPYQEQDMQNAVFAGTLQSRKNML